MKKEVGGFIVAAGFEASRRLSELLPIIKQHCSSDEYLRLSIGLATAIAMIGEEVMLPVYEMYPDLKDEIDRRVEEFDRAF